MGSSVKPCFSKSKLVIQVTKETLFSHQNVIHFIAIYYIVSYSYVWTGCEEQITQVKFKRNWFSPMNIFCKDVKNGSSRDYFRLDYCQLLYDFYGNVIYKPLIVMQNLVDTFFILRTFAHISCFERINNIQQISIKYLSIQLVHTFVLIKIPITFF